MSTTSTSHRGFLRAVVPGVLFVAMVGLGSPAFGERGGKPRQPLRVPTPAEQAQRAQEFQRGVMMQTAMEAQVMAWQASLFRQQQQAMMARQNSEQELLRQQLVQQHIELRKQQAKEKADEKAAKKLAMKAKAQQKAN